MSNSVPVTDGSSESTVRLSAKGRSRVKEILEAARTVLTENDYGQFSFRNVANEAGVHLSHLQYYFPSRNALVRALVEHVEQGYWDIYDELISSLPTTPFPRFLAILDFLIEDDQVDRTRRFFVQLWALLESSDETGQGKLLSKLYAGNIENLARYIDKINPDLGRGECHQRATMIHAMIDGMMLMFKEADRYLDDGQSRIEISMRDQLVRIATDPPAKRGD